MSAPERIWAASVTENYGEWQTTTDGLPRPTEYIRADLVMARIAALEAQLAETERSADHWLGEARRLLKAGQNAAYSLEATPPAPKVTDAMVDAALAEVRKHPRTKDQMAKLRVSVRRQIEAALNAAQEAGK